MIYQKCGFVNSFRSSRIHQTKITMDDGEFLIQIKGAFK